MFHFTRMAVAGGIALAVAACGGGGGGSAGIAPAPEPAPALTGNFFPTDAGSQWVYATGTGSPPDVVRLIGTRTIGAQNTYDFQTTDGTDNSTSHDYYAVDATGVRDYAAPDADPVSLAVSGVRLLPSPLFVGATFGDLDTTVDSGSDFDGDSKSDRMRIQSGATVIGTESVTTSSRYARACHVGGRWHERAAGGATGHASLGWFRRSAKCHIRRKVRTSAGGWGSGWCARR